jgi:hypothetical protein
MSHNSLLAMTRYFVMSVVFYILIMGGLYLLIDLLGVDKVTSYFVIYIFAYLFEYLLTLTMVFGGEHSWIKFFKFVFHTITFLVVGSELFRLLIEFNVHYSIALLFTGFILFPARFMSNKHFVYNSVLKLY